MRKPTLLGALAVTVTAAGGYLGLIAPQADAAAQVRSELATVEAANIAAEAKIPELKAQLDNITDSVQGLRELSRQVPASIDMPTLYAEINQVAQNAGPGVSISNVSVTVPSLLTPPDQVPTGEPAEPADTSQDTGTDTTADEPAAPEAEVTPSPSAVLASYQVSIEAKAGPDQAAAFLEALDKMPRLNVVSVTGMTVTGDTATIRVAATLFLQQVDVDGLASQIEALAAETSQDD